MSEATLERERSKHSIKVGIIKKSIFLKKSTNGKFENLDVS